MTFVIPMQNAGVVEGFCNTGCGIILTSRNRTEIRSMLNPLDFCRILILVIHPDFQFILLGSIVDGKPWIPVADAVDIPVAQRISFEVRIRF